VADVLEYRRMPTPPNASAASYQEPRIVNINYR
jgi:hypothetical protein